jgi:type I site-specific restriction endonuclease
LPENSDPAKRYKVVGYFDPDTRTIYYDMETAVEDAFRAPKE